MAGGRVWKRQVTDGRLDMAQFCARSTLQTEMHGEYGAIEAQASLGISIGPSR